MLSGVYVLFCGAGVYVGQSKDIRRRIRAHRAGRGLLKGRRGDWTIAKYLPGSSEPMRLEAEAAIATMYRRCNVPLVNRTIYPAMSYQSLDRSSMARAWQYRDSKPT